MWYAWFNFLSPKLAFEGSKQTCLQYDDMALCAVNHASIGFLFIICSHEEIDVTHPEFFSAAKQNGYVPPNPEVISVCNWIFWMLVMFRYHSLLIHLFWLYGMRLQLGRIEQGLLTESFILFTQMCLFVG